MRNIYFRHIEFWSKDNARLFLGSVLFFIVALFLQHFSYNYIDNRVVGTHVGDLLLDNLPIVI